MFKWFRKLFKKKIILNNWAAIPFKCVQYTVVQMQSNLWTVEIMLFFNELNEILDDDIKNPEKLTGLRMYMFGMIRETPDQVINELAAMGRLFKETNTVVNVVDKAGQFIVSYDIAKVQKLLQEKFTNQILPQNNNKVKQIISEGNSSIH